MSANRSFSSTATLFNGYVRLPRRPPASADEINNNHADILRRHQNEWYIHGKIHRCNGPVVGPIPPAAKGKQVSDEEIARIYNYMISSI
jgi:hypothetical protein